MDRSELDRIRQQALTPMEHSFTHGIIGGPCERCGTRQPLGRPCHLPATITVDRALFVELVDRLDRALLEIANAATEATKDVNRPGPSSA